MSLNSSTFCKVIQYQTNSDLHSYDQLLESTDTIHNCMRHLPMCICKTNVQPSTILHYKQDLVISPNNFSKHKKMKNANIFQKSFRGMQVRRVFMFANITKLYYIAPPPQMLKTLCADTKI